MNNIPSVKLGLVAVSRDAFPASLSKKRRDNLVLACKNSNIDIETVETIVENERDAVKALEEISNKKIDALVIYLGNFGPEGPTTLMAQNFPGPKMFAAAAEETQDDLIHGRGDAYCGMLNASYSLGLRNVSAYIPEYPVGTAEDIAGMIADFIPVARILLGVRQLKIFSFGPRPQDFLACNAPIKPLFDLGVEVMENSELDMVDAFQSAENHPAIGDIAKEMAVELGHGNNFPDLLNKLAQFEIALTQFMENHLGASRFAVFANKCWPSFEKYFKFVPCYINSRLAARGIPVACEVDIYGALSEYMLACATEMPVTILDINNSVPEDMYKASKKQIGDYKLTDLFMGFHCGNTPAACMVKPALKHQLIMHRLMEPDNEPDITRGTLEGQIKPGEATIFRLQSTADCRLKSYIAQGDVLNVDPKSFGSIGVIGIKEMGRFYRHVLIENRFPHHAGVGFRHVGKSLFSVLKLIGVNDVYCNLPENIRYGSENFFS